MDNLPTVKEETSLVQVTGPEDALAYAQRCSKALMDVVKQCDLAKNFGGKKDHIEYEGWGMIAEFYGCSIGADDAVPVKKDDEIIGYNAMAYVKRNSDGVTLSTAKSSCNRDEKNWKNKPDYQLQSMAQTRAGSKAARMKFSWIAALAGFSPTPAEEMVGVFENSKKNAPEGGKSPSGSTQKEKTRLDILKKFAAKNNDLYFIILEQHTLNNAKEAVKVGDSVWNALLVDLTKQIGEIE
jgi:hypothetical protein